MNASRNSVSRAVVCVVAACTMTLVLVVTPAGADPSDDKARVDRQIALTRAALESASQRVAAAAEAFAEANRRLPEVQQRFTAARERLAAATAHARTAETASRRAQANLAAANASLLSAQRSVQQTQELIGSYAAQAYMGRDAAGVEALLSVASPADFVAGLTYLDRVANLRQSVLDAHERRRTTATYAAGIQEQRTRAAELAGRQAQESVRAAADAEAQAAAARREVLAVIGQREQALRVADEERAETKARYEQLQAESARIAAEIRALARGAGPVVSAGARLPMPVRGWKTSDFGMRYDPFYKVWQLHAGVDFAAPGGSAIWAVQAGRVFRAGWNGGYGNYTCIYHGTYQGKGFASCYAHQSAIVVAIGQQVRRGQLIGRVGTTGASTGNHLHFEIRLDGNPVNPLPWLPACLC